MNLASIILKLVRGISSGTDASALTNTCESVTARAGLIPVLLRKASTSLSFRIIATASLSRISLMACTWGRINRPAGASTSIGVINKTISPYLMRSPSREAVFHECSGIVSFMSFIRSSKLRLSIAEKLNGLIPVLCSVMVTKAGDCSSRSHLLCMIIKGTSWSTNCDISSSSKTPHVLLATIRIPRSISSSVLKVLSILFLPRSPVSSVPAVSTSITGPKPVIS